jgi:hypothetical protein
MTILLLLRATWSGFERKEEPETAGRRTRAQAPGGNSGR